MIMRKFVFISVMFILFSYYGHSETPKVFAEIDSNSVLIGKRINLKINFKSQQKYKVIFPTIKDSLEKIELLEMSEPDTLFENDFRTIKRNYVITSFDSGSYNLGPYTLVYNSEENDNYNVLKTQPLKVTFTTVAVDTSEAIKDIKPPIEIGYSFYEILPYLIIVLLIALIVFLYIYSRRKKEKKKTPWIIEKPKVPPHQEAIEALDKLKKEELWQNGKQKEYHIKLTEIIRRYIERRYEIPALEMISDEIIREFEKTSVESTVVQNLKELLTLGDLTKFAKFNPLPKENEQSMEFAYNIVRKTMMVKENIQEENKNDRNS